MSENYPYVQNASSSKIDWRLVRGIGQLTALNRTSLMVLVIVPFLTYLWPAVQHTVMWYDGFLGEVEGNLDSIAKFASKNTSANAAVLRADESSMLAELATKVKILQRDIGELHSRSSVKLPRVWGLLFFSSLLVLLGRTIFQLRCPDTVRDLSVLQYVRARRLDYAEAPSVNLLMEAIDYIERHEIEAEHVAQFSASEKVAEARLDNLRDRLQHTESARINADKIGVEMRELDMRFEHLEEIMRETIEPHSQRQILADMKVIDDRREILRQDYLISIGLSGQEPALREEVRQQENRDQGNHGPEFRKKVAIVELAARYYYFEIAGTNRFSMALCGISYCLAAGLIFLVIYTQSLEVARSVGWGGPLT